MVCSAIKSDVIKNTFIKSYYCTDQSDQCSINNFYINNYPAKSYTSLAQLKPKVSQHLYIWSWNDTHLQASMLKYIPISAEYTEKTIRKQCVDWHKKPIQIIPLFVNPGLDYQFYRPMVESSGNLFESNLRNPCANTTAF